MQGNREGGADGSEGPRGNRAEKGLRLSREALLLQPATPSPTRANKQSWS